MKPWFAALYRQFIGSPLLMIGGVNALVFPLAILTSVLLARHLPKGEYGQLVYFYAGVGLIRLLMNLGLGTILSRDLAAAPNDAQRRTIVVCSLSIVRLTSILTVLLLVGSGVFAPINWLVVMTLAAICASLADFSFAGVAGMRRTAQVGWMSAFQPLVYLLLVGGAVVLHAASAAHLMVLYALSFLGMAGLGAWFNITSGLVSRPHWNAIQPTYIKSALMYVAPSYGTSLSSQLWTTLVVGTFGLMGQFEQSADFGIAFTLVTLAVAITGPTVVTVFFPQASYLFGTHQHAELQAQIRQTSLLFLRGLVAFALLIAAGAPLLMHVFGAHYLPVAPIVIALAPLAPLAGLLPVATLSLFAINRPWLALIGTGTQVALVALVVALVRPLSPSILILAALGSTAVALVLQFGLLARALKITFPSGSMLRALIVAASVLGLLEVPVALGLAPRWQSGIAAGLLVVYTLLEIKPLRLLHSIQTRIEVSHEPAA